MRALALLAFAAMIPALAHAQEEAVTDEFGLTGDWGGLRTDLDRTGFDFRITDTTQAAYAAQGGHRHAAEAAGQLTLGAKADLDKLFGDKGGAVYMVITDRYGASLSREAGLDTLMDVQDIYGRGDIWRLTQLYVQQDIGKALDVKLGRVSPGQDFDAFGCDFQNLTFCAAQAGNVVGDDWFNWPVSQWGARAKLKFGDAGYVQAGAYDVNPENLAHGFTFDTSASKGTLIPFEAGFTPSPGGLPGAYAVGGWYDTSHGPDVILDVNGDLQALTGLAAEQHSGRYGWYLHFKQQLTGRKDKQGLTVFLRMLQADRRTSVLDRQIALGATYRGFLASRPDDRLGVAVGATHVNSRVAEGEAAVDALGGPFSPVQHTEYAAELNYSLQLAKGLTLTPDLQYVRDPGGVSARRDAVVLGLQVKAKL